MSFLTKVIIKKRITALLTVFTLVCVTAIPLFATNVFASTYQKMLVIASSQYAYDFSNLKVVNGSCASNITDIVLEELTATDTTGTGQINLIKALYGINPYLKIWVSLPSINANNYTSITYATLTTYLNTLKTGITNSLGATVWSNYIAGVYINEENVYGTPTNYSNLTGTSSDILRMSQLSSYVKSTLGKKFLWIPYYGVTSAAQTAEVNVKNIAYIANTTNYFDYVILQPHYYNITNATGITASPTNLNGVAYSVQNSGNGTGGAITYRDGSVVVAKTSSARIGFEMENSVNVSNSGTYSSYTSTLTPIRNACPVAYYYDVTSNSGPNMLAAAASFFNY